MNKIYHTTPTLFSHQLKKEKNLNVFYKMECYQPSGSFKIRGMEHLVKHHLNHGKNKFIASSGGNAGYSLAYVGNKLGVNVEVILPTSTPKYMIQKIEQLDAIVNVKGDVWDEANNHALEKAKSNNSVYVSPFDDKLLWEGHSTMIDECAIQMPKPTKIILSVGGGGLLCGVLKGLKKINWNDIEIITTETEGAASFYNSYNAKKIIELHKIQTVATSLGAKKISEQAFSEALNYNISPQIMSDKKAIDATKLLFEEKNILVEPACGAALSIPYFNNELLNINDIILVIVCGGVNTSIDQLLI